MKLHEWTKRDGRGSLSRLSRKTGLAYTTVFEAVHGTRRPQYDTAKKISAATSGAVSIEELMGGEDEHEDSLPPSAA